MLTFGDVLKLMNDAQGLENGVMMDKQIIFEDEQIRVIFLKGSSEELIFSFGDLITRAKGFNINAEKSLHKLLIPILIE